MMCSQDPLPFPLPVFETRFTSTELDEVLSFFQPTDNIIMGSVNDDSSPQPFSSNCGLDDPNDDEMNKKKRKRKMSNRESARRSRWRKKRHLEDLTAEVNRIKTQNSENANRLGLALNQLRSLKMENELMRFECAHLIQRHAALNRVLQAMQYNNTTNNTNSDRFDDSNGLFNH